MSNEYDVRNGHRCESECCWSPYVELLNCPEEMKFNWGQLCYVKLFLEKKIIQMT